MHTLGIAIITPDYETNFEDFEEMIDIFGYDDYKGVQYVEEINDFEKIYFMLVQKQLNKTIFKDFLEDRKNKFPNEDYSNIDNGYIFAYNNNDLFLEYINELYPNILDEFPTYFQKYAEDWNDTWQYDYTTNTYVTRYIDNPNSSFDYYSKGGRWSGYLLTKQGKECDNALIQELTLDDEKHFGKEYMPAFFIVNGIMTSYEKQKVSKDEWSANMWEMINKLPQDSELYVVDFHF